MAKKNDNLSKEINSETNASLEKIREDLFQYRVEIQSYKRSMKMLERCVCVVLAILGFAGYKTLADLIKSLEERANARLEKTDALLAKVDMRSIDSLMAIVKERTIAYEAAIDALDNGTRINNELYKKLISGLPYNRSVENTYPQYVGHPSNNLFDIVYYDSEYQFGKTGECYVVMGDEYIKEKSDMLLIRIIPKGRGVAVVYQTYEVHSNYNRLSFSFNKFEDYKEYELSVILLRKHNGSSDGYAISKPLFYK